MYDESVIRDTRAVIDLTAIAASIQGLVRPC
jgi:hypothetical protein